MNRRILAAGLSGLALTAAGLVAACNPPQTEDRGPPRGEPSSAPPPVATLPPTTAPGALPPNGDPRAAPRSIDDQVVARAELRPTQGNTAMGRVNFTRSGDTITVQVVLMGLTPGPHGIHIHENGDCSAPDAASAGEHFNPEARPHGGLESPPTERHPGDLGNVTAKDTGDVEETITSQTLVENGQFAMLGKAIVVHEELDDERSQPSGNSGDAAACGVITAASPAPDAHLG